MRNKDKTTKCLPSKKNPKPRKRLETLHDKLKITNDRFLSIQIKHKLIQQDLHELNSIMDSTYLLLEDVTDVLWEVKEELQRRNNGENKERS